MYLCLFFLLHFFLPPQVWMFQRFTVVMEYQQKPVLPPPFIALCHFYSLLKYCVRKAKGEPGMSKFSFVPCESIETERLVRAVQQ